jgi:hypothetical protein
MNELRHQAEAGTISFLGVIQPIWVISHTPVRDLNH